MFASFRPLMLVWSATMLTAHGWSPAPSARPAVGLSLSEVHSVRSSQRHAAVSLSESEDAVIQQRVANGLSHVVLGQADELLKSRDTGPADAALSVRPGGLLNALRAGRGGKFVDDSYYILLFPAAEQHIGVYTLQGKETAEPSKARRYLLAFEQLGDAVRFAALLQAQGLSAPAPTERSAEQLLEFCSKATLRLGVMPAGALPLSSESIDLGRLRLEACFHLRDPPHGSGPQLER